MCYAELVCGAVYIQVESRGPLQIKSALPKSNHSTLHMHVHTQYGAKASWDFRSAMAKLGLKAKGASSSKAGEGGAEGEEGSDGEGEEDGLDADAVKELATEEALQKVGGWVWLNL